MPAPSTTGGLCQPSLSRGYWMRAVQIRSMTPRSRTPNAMVTSTAAITTSPVILRMSSP